MSTRRRRKLRPGRDSVAGVVLVSLLIGLAVVCAALGILWWTSAAAALDCPPERPIKRTVENSRGGTDCLMLTCQGRMACPADESKPCRVEPGPSCAQQCVGASVPRCLTRREVEEATRDGR